MVGSRGAELQPSLVTSRHLQEEACACVGKALSCAGRDNQLALQDFLFRNEQSLGRNKERKPVTQEAGERAAQSAVPTSALPYQTQRKLLGCSVCESTARRPLIGSAAFLKPCTGRLRPETKEFCVHAEHSRN